MAGRPKTQEMNRRCRISRWMSRAAVAAVFALAARLAAAVPIVVDGLGWLHDREMRFSLERLTNAKAVDALDANAVEDAAVILNSALTEDGFQEPVIAVEATLTDGSQRRFTFDPTFAKPVPRPLPVRALTFKVDRGVRWRVAHVVIDGLRAFPPPEGEAYFRSDATLFTVARTNAYSKSQLNRSESALLDELRRRGFAEATVRAEVTDVDHKSGDVTVHVAVHEGPRWQVRSVEITHGEAAGVTLPDPAAWQGENYSPALEQDIREAVRVSFYKAGYPDVGIHVETDPAEPEDGRRDTDITVTVVPGARVAMGHARFEGNKVTRESVLSRRVGLKPGDPLNPIALEHARYRISRLGVFESVDLHYEPPDGATRDPIFVLKEGPRYETNLLAGYGSYEEFRAGVEYRQMNIFGLAHQSRLLLVQSVKSTRGEYTYTVPELFGETVDGTAKLFGLERQEIAFLRQEYGATLSLRRAISRIHGEATAGYTFEALRNRKNSLLTEPTDEKQLNVAHLDFGLTTNRLDNPLRPRRGYHANLQFELATPNIGGVAQYQRAELNGAYHTPWGRGRWFHVGFAHGFITTMGAPNDKNLPVNKRFYPGGDNSIRGYRLGEAAPRAPDGRYIGAKSYMLLNLELEQALTTSWSIVAFADALGNATTLRDYPFREKLYSVGLGIRYQTIVGPVRLEYGRNVNPRPADPGGTLQISRGYPF
jgi:outer membrane protein assembly complex protein YaeT